MKVLRAVHSIVLTIKPGERGDKAKGVAPTRPVTKTLEPGTKFRAQNAEQEKELIDSGAAVEAEAASEDPIVDTKSPKTEKPAPAADDGKDPAQDGSKPGQPGHDETSGTDSVAGASATKGKGKGGAGSDLI